MGSWKNYLSRDSLYLASALSQRARMEGRSKEILPPHDHLFQAMTLTQPEDVKVVILGQDPYHGPGLANGLAFSVNPGVKVPPSLQNIYKELHDDLGCPIPTTGDLTPWAKQGVLLLNSVLTVEAHKPTSHKDWGWQEFVSEVLHACMELPQPIVFLLWGGYARAFCADLPFDQHHLNKEHFWSSHPSPLGATKGNEAVPAFLGSRPFSKTNDFLVAHGSSPVDWAISDPE